MYKRVFLLVFDSLGIGNGKDAKKYDDLGSNTLNSALMSAPYHLPCLSQLGLLNLSSNLTYHNKSYDSVISKINASSPGKDSLSGHLEMMGIKSEIPAKVFGKAGFPDDLIAILEEKWGKKIIGNKVANDLDIIKELGETHLQSGEVIVYTSYDSTMYISTNEMVVEPEELYKMAQIAREVTNDEKWRINRIIARPFMGTNKSNFYFTNNKKNFVITSTSDTYLDNLKSAGHDVIALGKVNELFNGKGITYAISTKSNIDCMDKLINITKNAEFNGLCFANLEEFDSDYGHKRNPLGYLRCLEDVDVKLRSFIANMKNDDLLIISADHGNDPAYKGFSHTREQLPFVAYSKQLTNKGYLISAQDSLACIGATINDNFGLAQKEYQIGNSLLNMIK